MSENHVTEPADGEELQWPDAVVCRLVYACRAARTSSEFDTAINKAAEENGSQYDPVRRLVWGIAIGYRQFFQFRSGMVEPMQVPDYVPSTYGEQTMVQWWLSTKSEHKGKHFNGTAPEIYYAVMFGRTPEWCLKLIKYLRGGVDAGAGFGFNR